MNGTPRDNTPTLLQHFKSQCQRNPNAIAIDDGTTECADDLRPKVTYSELDALSEQWSRRLYSAGVRAGSIVPILSRRCISMVAAVLAILKLRATYVPMDLDSWSEDRMKSVLERLNSPLVVATSIPNEQLDGYTFLLLDHGNGDRDCDVGQNLPCIEEYTGSLDDIAYICFTSGTTGKPKGVVIGQRSISSYVMQGGELPFNLNTTVGSRALLICSIAFDACAGILFTTICNGGTLVLADPPTMERMAKKCTTLALTPSILASLDPSVGFEEVTNVFLGGESPTPQLIQAWSTPTRRLYNAYGPTEATCSAFIGELKPGSPITVGYPISYSRTILIDEAGQESSEGEIWISGTGLAVGYYNDTERTDESFVMHHETRFYRTGDYGKQTTEGLQFCGRRDNLVKHRGFLINLETEVEPALLSSGYVDRAVALKAGDKLIGFVTPESAATGLRELLSDRYSPFQIPDVIYGLSTFPLTGHDKIDRKTLLAIHSAENVTSGETIFSQTYDPLSAVRQAVSHVLQIPLENVCESSSIRDLGGNSLAAVRLVTVLRKLGYSTGVSQVLVLDIVADLAASVEIEQPSAAGLTVDVVPQASLIGTTITERPGVSPVPPMTDMQTRLVRSSIANPGLAFVKTAFTFEHPGDATFQSKLHSAWTKVYERHGILRTSFSLSSSQGVQLLSPNPDIAWKEIAISNPEWESACAKNENIQLDEFSDFNEGNCRHLSHIVTITVPSERTRCIWTIHHSLIDGWSMGILMADLAMGFENGSLPRSLQFSDAAAALNRLEMDSKSSAVKFWASSLDGFLPASRLRLPPPPELHSFEQGEQRSGLSFRVSEINHAASAFKVTSACLLHAAWGLLLSRYCDSDNVIMGTVLSGRNLPIPGIEQIVGPFINTLPLAVNTEAGQSTGEFVRSVFRSMCGMLDFQWTSSSVFQESCHAKATDLFETLLVLQYDLPSAPWGTDKVCAPKNIQYNEMTEVPLTILVDAVDGELVVRLIYLKSHFSDSTVRNMIKHFDNILSALLRSSSTQELANVSQQMLESEEFKSLIQPPKALGLMDVPRSLSQAVNSSIQKFPGEIAVEGPTESLLYGELGERTEKIAAQLISHGACGKVVCVISDGSVNWLLAAIGVIRAGATYCPVDMKLPVERQRYIADNSRASVILFPTTQTREASPSFDRVTVLDVETTLVSGISAGTGCNYDQAEDDICCLVYTSGSTGLPKAVQLQNKNILNLLSQPHGRMFSRPGQRNAQALSLGFDVCILEIFSSLCNGATLVLKDPKNPFSNLSQVDATVATPSLLATLDPSDYPKLKIIVLGGEPCQQAISDRWSSGRKMFNMYGPAECTLFSVWTLLEPGVKVSVGKSVDGMTAYVLDALMRPVPIGISGEVYLSGAQVSPGYLYNEQETKLRFLPDPFHPQLRMFKTGDIGRVLENGNLDILGRDDNMVKLRGFRIDLGEVQATIGRVAANDVKNSAIITWNGNLFAFVTPANVDVNSLQTQLVESLPEHAVPNRIIALESLPLSNNLKVDRKLLQEILAKEPTGKPASQPLDTATEQVVATIWVEVLKLDPETASIGPDDRFFSLGGHSLLQIQVAQAIRKKWNIPLPLREVVRYQRLRDLCQALDQKLGETNETAISKQFIDSDPVDRESKLPISYLESEMLLNHHISEGSPVGNMRFVCTVTGDINIELLSKAIYLASTTIEVFRSRFDISSGSMTRSLVETGEPPQQIETTDPEPIIQAKLNRKFDLSVDSPIDASLLIQSTTQITIVVVMSHTVGDARTIAGYLNHVSRLYHNGIQHSDGSLTDVDPRHKERLSYLDWAKWTENMKPDMDIIAFWKSYLSDLPEPLFLGNPGGVPAYRGSTRSLTFSSSLQSDLSRIAAGLSITMHQLILGAVFFCVQCIDARDDLIVAAPFMHRTETGTEDLPGLFLDRLILRIRRKMGTATESLAEFLKSVQESSQQALAHPITYRSLREIINLRPNLLHPLFKVMVTYHRKMENLILQLDGATVRPLRRYNDGAKFPLTFEFTELPEGGILLELEYDSGIVTEHVARRLEHSLSLALYLIVQNAPVDRIIRLVTSSFGSADETQSTEFTGSAEVNPKPEPPASRDSKFDAKRNLILEAMAQCLGLSKDTLSTSQQFWSLGAESVDAIRFQYLCEQRGVNITLTDIFTCKGAAELAKKAVLASS